MLGYIAILIWLCVLFHLHDVAQKNISIASVAAISFVKNVYYSQPTLISRNISKCRDKLPTPQVQNYSASPPLHGYDYVIIPTSEECQLKQSNKFSLILVALIFSTPCHFKRRMTIRETWASLKITRKGFNVKFIFVLGQGNKQEQANIVKESSKYNDIIQKKFIDSYQNLSLKSCAAIEWVSKYCPTTSYVLKVDDDVFVNTYVILNYLNKLLLQAFTTRKSVLTSFRNTGTTYPIIACFIHNVNEKIIIRKGNKEMEIDSDYPRFCAGPAYLMERQAVTAIYRASLCAEYHPYEDVLITGMLASRAKVRLISLGRYYCFRPQNLTSLFTHSQLSRKYMFYHLAGIRQTDDEVMRNLWQNVTSRYI